MGSHLNYFQPLDPKLWLPGPCSRFSLCFLTTFFHPLLEWREITNPASSEQGSLPYGSPGSATSSSWQKCSHEAQVSPRLFLATHPSRKQESGDPLIKVTQLCRKSEQKAVRLTHCPSACGLAQISSHSGLFCLVVFHRYLIIPQEFLKAGGARH